MKSPLFPNYDVLILGAGPAGTATAIQSAQGGLRVALIEPLIFPRHRPGESLHPGIEPLLQQLGVREAVLSAAFLRYEGTLVRWEGNGHFVPFGSDKQGKWRGFQAWRGEFDQILLNRAKSLGVEVLQPCRPLNLIQEKSVMRVETSSGTFFASFVVDATGRKRWLARKLGLTTKTYSPRLITYYGYVKGNCAERSQIPSLVADEKGWTWTARVKSDVYQWTRLCFEPSNIRLDWLPDEFKSLQPQGRRRKEEVTWQFIDPLAGEHYFLVGDAAFVLDPASSHGVLKGIMSGMMAGHLMTQVFHSQSDYSAIANIYNQWLKNWFTQDLAKLRELYRILPTPPSWI